MEIFNQWLRVLDSLSLKSGHFLDNYCMYTVLTHLGEDPQNCKNGPPNPKHLPTPMYRPNTQLFVRIIIEPARVYAYVHLVRVRAISGRGITGIGWAWHHVPVDHAPFRLREGVGYPMYMILMAEAAEEQLARSTGSR